MSGMQSLLIQMKHYPLVDFSNVLRKIINWLGARYTIYRLKQNHITLRFGWCSYFMSPNKVQEMQT